MISAIAKREPFTVVKDLETCDYILLCDAELQFNTVCKQVKTSRWESCEGTKIQLEAL